MADFKQAEQNTLDYEGKILEKVPGDPGGETIYGIDRENNPNWVGWQILDHMSNTGKTALAACEDLQAAINLYYKDLWDRIKGDQITDQHLANYIFDSEVNPGPLTLKKVQNILDVAEDGIYGDSTIEAINVYDPAELLEKIKDWRISYYDSKGTWADKFQAGWHNRANEIKN